MCQLSKKSLHLVIKKLVHQYGTGIVEDHRLKGLLADELGEAFDNEVSFEQAYKMGVGRLLLKIRPSLNDVSLKLDAIKQGFAERSLLERPISDYVVDCMAYGIGLVKSVKKTSLDGTTIAMNRKITQLNAIIARQEDEHSQELFRARRIRMMGLFAFMISVALFMGAAKFFVADVYDGPEELKSESERLLEAEKILKAKEHILNNQELFDAVSKGDNARINALLSKGADVRFRNSLGETLLFAAVRGNNLTWAQKLLTMGLSADDKNLAGQPAYYGVRNNTARYIKNVANRDEFFVISVRNNKLDSAKYFLDLGADVNYVDVKNQYTAAHYAVYYNNVEALKKLKSWGANLNKRTTRDTPIELAMDQNCQKAFRYLLTAVPGIANQELSNGERLLHRGVRNRYRNVWVGALIAAGANIHQEDSYGNQPIHVAAQYGDSNLVKLLVNKGVDPKVENRDGKEVVEIAEKYDNKSVERYLDQFYVTGKIKRLYNDIHDFVAGII